MQRLAAPAVRGCTLAAFEGRCIHAGSLRFCVASWANGSAIRPAKRLASPALRSSRCSPGRIHGPLRRALPAVRFATSVRSREVCSTDREQAVENHVENPPRSTCFPHLALRRPLPGQRSRWFPPTLPHSPRRSAHPVASVSGTWSRVTFPLFPHPLLRLASNYLTTTSMEIGHRSRCSLRPPLQPGRRSEHPSSPPSQLG